MGYFYYRYQMLLQTLIKHTPNEHVEYATLQSAKEKMVSVITEINARKDSQENLKTLEEIDQKLTSKMTTPHSPQRKLLHEGAVVDGLSDAYNYVYFFTDLMLLCKTKTKEK